MHRGRELWDGPDLTTVVTRQMTENVPKLRELVQDITFPPSSTTGAATDRATRPIDPSTRPRSRCAAPARAREQSALARTGRGDGACDAGAVDATAARGARGGGVSRATASGALGADRRDARARARTDGVLDADALALGERHFRAGRRSRSGSTRTCRDAARGAERHRARGAGVTPAPAATAPPKSKAEVPLPPELVEPAATLVRNKVGLRDRRAAAVKILQVQAGGQSRHRTCAPSPSSRPRAAAKRARPRLR